MSKELKSRKKVEKALGKTKGFLTPVGWCGRISSVMEEHTTPHPAVFKAKYHGCPFDGTSNSGFYAHVPELPNAEGDGKTFEEMKEMLFESIAYELEDKMLMEEWEQIPPMLREVVSYYVSEELDAGRERELLDFIKESIIVEFEREEINCRYID